MVGVYKLIVEFIKFVKKVKLDVKFVNIFFVGLKVLLVEFGDVGEGVIVL